MHSTPESTPLTPRRFSVDGGETWFDGYATAGEQWNGWACPLFTREQADAIVAAWPSLCTDSADPAAAYDAERDAYTFVVGGYVETFRRAETVVGPHGEPLYAIGAYAWAWAVCEEEEDRCEYCGMPVSLDSECLPLCRVSLGRC